MPHADVSRREWVLAAGLLTAAAAVPDVAVGSGAPLVRLSLNEGAFGPSPTVARAIAAQADRLHRYVEPAEVEALVAQIAALERVAPEQVILGEILGPLGLALARRRNGGGIVFSTPGYTELVDAAAPLAGRPVPIPLDHVLANDLPAIERAVDGDTIAVSLVNPNNPTGTVDDADALAAFISRVARRTTVIIDEAYLEYDDLARRSAVRFVRDGADVVVFRTLAKIHGLAGLAIGYGLGPAKLIAELRAAGVGAPHALNRLSLAAASAALADQAWVAQVRARTVSERERLTRALARLRLRHSDSRASFAFFDAGDRAAAARAAFADAGIQIARPFPPLDRWLRITIGTPSENDAVIRVLDRSFA